MDGILFAGMWIGGFLVGVGLTGMFGWFCVCGG